MKQLPILVVGGAGFIGSHVNKQLHLQGYSTVVFDNLSRSNRQAVTDGEFIFGDIGSLSDLYKLFYKQRFAAVMHFAGLTDVGASIINPLQYYHDNVSNSLQLINLAIMHDVRVFIFSSSAAIFGNPEQATIDENHPKKPLSPYGHSKLMVEQFLADCDRAYGLKSCCLRYFNATGSDHLCRIANVRRHENNLIPLLFESLAENGKTVTLFGTDYPTFDGTCIRDYIHVSDLAKAHILGMEKIFQENRSFAYNLGNGQGYSVRQVIDSVARVTGQTPKVVDGARRPGDAAQLIADPTLAKRELGWESLYDDLDTMIDHAWKAHKRWHK